MKHKLFSLMISSFIMTAVFSQSTVAISINGVKKGAYNIEADQIDAGLVLKKSACKKMNKIAVQITGEFIGNTAYVRTLDIVDKTGQSLLNVPETAAGLFNTANAAVKTKLLKGDTIKLYLLMNPADSRMMIPSKRIYMGSLSVK